MTLQAKHWTAGLLAVSGVALASLVPGGPIETRSFAHLDSLTLSAFNTFLTALVLSSLLLVYFVLKSERWAMWAAAVCGFSFLGVYGLDLAKLFPVSPDAMPPALLAVEVLGAIIAMPLIAFSTRALQSPVSVKPAVVLAPYGSEMPLPRSQRMLIGVALGLVGLGTIVFATRAAMGF